MHRITFVAIIALFAAPLKAHEPADGVDIRIGVAGPSMDACPTIGEVTGLNPDGDNFLALRAAPTTQASKIDQLASGEPVWICDATDDGDWLGVVVGPWREPGVSCDVTHNQPEPVPYIGPCRSGWVSARYITPIAG